MLCKKERARLECACASPLFINELDIGIARLTHNELQMREIFETQTKLTAKEVRQLVETETLLSVDYALKVGIVHEIIIDSP